MQCVLLATDGSDNANRATDFAARSAKAMGLALWILNVTDALGLTAGELSEFSYSEHVSRRELIESLSAQILGKARDRAEANGAREIRVESRRGDTAQTIIEFAEEKDAAMIVVGRRGTGALPGLLVGSVTHKLIALAPCAVTVIP